MSIDTPSFIVPGTPENKTGSLASDLSFQSSLGSPIGASSPRALIYKPKRNKAVDNFKIAIVNCQSIKNKVAQFATFIDVTQPNIIMGTESCLSSDIKNSEIFPDEYNVIRRDRSTGHKKGGGGIFLLVKNEYTCTEIETETTCELLFAKLELLNSQSVTIGCFYRPPDSDENYMSDFISGLQKVNPKHDKNIWIGGDFNLPKVNWPDMCVLPGNPAIVQSELLINSALDHSLSQLASEPTRKDNILDLFFTSTPLLVNRVGVIPPLGEADHNIVFLDMNTRAARHRKSAAKRHIFHKADWPSMEEELKDFTFSHSEVCFTVKD